MRLAALTLVLASLTFNLNAAPKGRSRRSHHAANGSVHVVRRGETAAKVARVAGLSLQELAHLNPGVNLSRLSVGTRLRVRGTVEAARPADPTPAASPSEIAPSTPVPPLAALPATPAIGPEAMPHLEGLLPYQVRIPLPADLRSASSLPADGHTPPDSARELLALMKPVVPPVTREEMNALLPTFTPADPDHLDLLWPVGTRTISSAWGPRIRTRVVRVRNHRKKRIHYRGRHKGVDLTAPMGTPVFAAMDGKVIMSGRHRQYGNYIILDHGNGVMTLYAHAKVNLVHEGEIVHRGQQIAEVGRTGNATGPHLHFELRVNGVQQNPLPALDDEEEVPAEMAAKNALLNAGRR
ncbi:MAG TPA: peptidoglycan DD-metalloendopeptidase family protein [Holophagaceae bacterium]